MAIRKKTRDYILPLFIAFMCIGGMVGCTKSESVQAKVENKALLPEFVKGINNSAVFDSENTAYTYKCGRTFKIESYYKQVGVYFYAINENNQRQRLSVDFGQAVDNTEGLDDLREGARIQIGQYDFDADGIDELIIAFQQPETTTTPIYENGVTVNVFKLAHDQWVAIPAEPWAKDIKGITGVNITGDPVALVKVNKITIPRGLHGFYYQWTLIGNIFVFTGDV